LISFMDKNLFELSKDRYAAKFCQKMIETKFKDKRLKRSLLKIVGNLDFFLADKVSATLVSTYVNMEIPSELLSVAEYCKTRVLMIYKHRLTIVWTMSHSKE